MNKLFIFVFTLTTSLCFSQDVVIPKIAWHNTSDSTNQYVDLLHLEDENALIFTWWIRADLPRIPKVSAIAFLNNGAIRRFNIFHDHKNKTSTTTEIVVDNVNYIAYWNYLDSCISQKKFQLDKSQLNSSPKTTVTKEPAPDSPVTIIRSQGYPSHGLDYHLKLYQGKNILSYRSYDIGFAIENEMPGFEEKQKLLNLFEELKSLIENY